MAKYNYEAAFFQEERKRFEEKIYELRTRIIYLMPGEIQQLLRSYYSSVTIVERRRWAENTALAIIEFAVPINTEYEMYYGKRALCPLCGRGPDSPYDQGFAIPEGLRRHLTGYGNAKQCAV